MWNLVRKWFSTPEAAVPSLPGSEPTALSFAAVTVQPDDGEDFESAACERLLAAIQSAGATDVLQMDRIAVSLEDFFEGNRCKHSLAANVLPPAPYDTLESWYKVLKTLRQQAGVRQVLVGITMIEPYEDGRLGAWPYSDQVWVYTAGTVTPDMITSALAPLEPDEITLTTDQPDEWCERWPGVPQRGELIYSVWWD